jgi:hypothetical protein
MLLELRKNAEAQQPARSAPVERQDALWPGLPKSITQMSAHRRPPSGAAPF